MKEKNADKFADYLLYWLETTEKTWETVSQDQGEKMLHSMLDQGLVAQQEGRKVLNDWMTMAKKGREEYRKLMIENMSRVSEFFNGATETATPVAQQLQVKEKPEKFIMKYQQPTVEQVAKEIPATEVREMPFNNTLYKCKFDTMPEQPTDDYIPADQIVGSELSKVTDEILHIRDNKEDREFALTLTVFIMISGNFADIAESYMDWENRPWTAKKHEVLSLYDGIINRYKKIINNSKLTNGLKNTVNTIAEKLKCVGDAVKKDQFDIEKIKTARSLTRYANDICNKLSNIETEMRVKEMQKLFEKYDPSDH